MRVQLLSSPQRVAQALPKFCGRRASCLGLEESRRGVFERLRQRQHHRHLAPIILQLVQELMQAAQSKASVLVLEARRHVLLHLEQHMVALLRSASDERHHGPQPGHCRLKVLAHSYHHLNQSCF